MALYESKRVFVVLQYICTKRKRQKRAVVLWHPLRRFFFPVRCDSWMDKRKHVDCYDFLVQVAVLLRWLYTAAKEKDSHPADLPLWMFTGVLGNVLGALLLFLLTRTKKRQRVPAAWGSAGMMVRRALSITKNAVLYLNTSCNTYRVICNYHHKMRAADSKTRRRALIAFTTPAVYTLGSTSLLIFNGGKPGVPPAGYGALSSASFWLYILRYVKRQHEFL